jgi:hypothetical protein
MQEVEHEDGERAAGAAEGVRERVQSRAQAVSGRAAEAIQGLAGQAGDTARELAGQAGGAAQEARGRAGGVIRSQIDQRTGWAAERVGASAGDLRGLAEELRQKDRDGPARLAEQAAERAERLGDYLSGANADRLLRDLEAIGRRQPWTVALAALALGFAAARVVKASAGGRGGDLPRGVPDGHGRAAGMPEIQPGGYVPAEVSDR